MSQFWNWWLLFWPLANPSREARFANNSALKAHLPLDLMGMLRDSGVGDDIMVFVLKVLGLLMIHVSALLVGYALAALHGHR